MDMKILNIFKKSYWVSLLSQTGETGKPTNIDYPDSYDSSWLVYRCVKTIAENVAKTNFHLYRLKNNKVIEIDQHPVLDLIYNPNSITTGFEFLEMTQTCLEIFGNAYWYKVRGGNRIQQLWIMRPDWVSIRMDEQGNIVSYEYKLGTETKVIEANDVIHFKNPNPKSSLYGLSPIKPAIDIISNLVFATRWNKNFFQNNARPDYWLISKSKLEKDEKEELKNSIRSEYGGVKNAHKFGFLTGEIEIKEMNQSMREMEFSKLTESAIQQILASFGIGKSIIGMQGMNRAEAESQIYSFMAFTIEPKIKRLVERINEFLLPEYGDDLYLDYDDPTPENREAKILEYKSAIESGWMTINEVRELEGLQPIKEASKKEEEFQKKMKIKILKGRKNLKTKIKLKNEIIEIIKTQRELAKKLKFTQEQKEAIWKQHDELLDKDEKLFKTFVIKLFKDQEKRFLEELKLEKDKSNLLNWNGEVDLFVSLSIPVFTNIVERRGQRASNFIGMTFQVNQKVKDYISDKAFKFADQVNTTTQNKLREALKEGVEQGEGIPQLRTRVNEVFAERTKYEAERIARTEIIDAHNHADLLAYRQSNVVSHKEWLAEMDNRTSEICQKLNGEVVLLNENFSDGSDAPPAHVNCRSTILPIIKDF
jgi:HK97 family phage portal protein